MCLSTLSFFCLPLLLKVFTWGMDRLGAAFGESNIFAHVAASQQDCLSQLLLEDLVAEALPVSLGGSWTGGCEPWRMGSNGNGSDSSSSEYGVVYDALTLEIETDLTCLFRNSIWSHNQAATAARKQRTTLPLSSLPLDGSSSKMPASGSAMHRKEGDSSASICSVESPDISWPPITDTGSRAVSGETTRKRNMASKETTEKQQQQQQAETEEGITTESAEDKRARRRRMHKEADRVRRAKERIEIEALQRQYYSVSQENESLKKEQRRLESLVQDVNDLMATEALSSS
jgi:hypothetical protein